jgi:hypothetical protein
MQTSKMNRPAFQSVELDTMDQRLEVKAVEKGIPTLVSPAPAAAPAVAARKRARAGDAALSTPLAATKPLNVQVPDYAWVAIKVRAAQERVSIRYVIMSALRGAGFEIKDVDMHEGGRRSQSTAAD